MDDVGGTAPSILEFRFLRCDCDFGVRRYCNINQQEDNICCKNSLTYYVTHSKLQKFLYNWHLKLNNLSRCFKKVISNIWQYGKNTQKFSNQGNYGAYQKIAKFVPLSFFQYHTFSYVPYSMGTTRDLF